MKTKSDPILTGGDWYCGAAFIGLMWAISAIPAFLLGGRMVLQVQTLGLLALAAVFAGLGAGTVLVMQQLGRWRPDPAPYHGVPIEPLVKPSHRRAYRPKRDEAASHFFVNLDGSITRLHKTD